MALAMRAVPYRYYMEKIELSLEEQDLCDSIMDRFESVSDFKSADLILPLIEFHRFIMETIASDIPVQRFLYLMKLSEFSPTLNEFNQKYYWLLRKK